MTQELHPMTPTGELALIVRDESGSVDLEISAEAQAPVADLCALAIREGGLATQDGAGHPLRYVLALKRESRFLDPSRSLAEEGVQPGDTLEIVTKMVGGGFSSDRRRRDNDRREVEQLAQASRGALAVRTRSADEFEVTLAQAHLTGKGRIAKAARFVVSLPSDYPEARPVVRFASPVPFHPNVYISGILCYSEWRPGSSLVDLLTMIALFLSGRDVNLHSPANDDAVRYYRSHPGELTALRPVPLAAGGSLPSDPPAAPTCRVVRRR